MKRKKATRHSPKRRRSKKRQTFRTRNWSEYNRSLVDRGSLTIWFDVKALEHWECSAKTGQRGASNRYSDMTIMMALTLKAVYRQTLRGTEGLLNSILELMQLTTLPVPDFSTLSRRAKRLSIALEDTASRGALHLVVDATGCKVFGEGEWKVRMHGFSKRRTWRKLHFGVDEANGQIKAAMLTTSNMHEGKMLEALVSQVEEPIRQVSADGAYDQRDCYRVLEKRSAQQRRRQALRVAIPPRRGSRIKRHGNRAGTPEVRDESVRRIRQVGRAGWKREVDYHRRSLAETAVFRLKRVFGDALSFRNFESQATEAYLRCRILNEMNRMGRPDSYRVEIA